MLILNSKALILNSKAFYLKNYSVPTPNKSHRKALAPKTETKRKQPEAQIGDIFRIRNINRLPRVITVIQTCVSASLDNSSMRKDCYTVNKDCSVLYQRQKQILLKLIKKQRQKRRKKKSVTDYVVLEDHPLGEVKTFDFVQMKPTDRYFHQMDNVRLAEKLLLVQPTSSTSKKQSEKFYKEQSKLRSNISKLSYRNSPSKRRQLQRQKWID